MEYLLGQVQLFAFNKPIRDWVVCDGRTLSVMKYQALYSLIGNHFGGDQVSFKVPDLRGSEPLPGMAYYICVNGLYPELDW